MRLRRLTLHLAVLATVSLVSAALLVPAGAGAATTPTLQAQPSTNVADGQVITVTGSGFTAGATVAIVECQSSATNESGCDLSTYQTATASDTGGFSTPYIASRYIEVGGLTPATIDCAVVGACILGAANYSNLSEAAATPLSFDPTAPTPPPLQLGGSLSPTGTVVHKTGVVTLSGTVTCNRPVYASISGDLSQVYHRFVFTSYFFASVLCTSSNTWTVVVQPANGLFNRGTATVNAAAYGYVDGSSSQADLSGTVTLTYPKNPHNPHA